MSSPDVYGTTSARLRSRVFSPLAARARARRHDAFFTSLGLPGDARILDVGCGALGLRTLEPDRDITGVDLTHRPEYPGPFVQADATDRLPFGDHEFDLVYSSSVIEHVPRRRRTAFARELSRVGRGLYVQTPAYSFPLEPHGLLPFAHWMPARPRRHYWRLGAQGMWEDVELLRRAEMQALFPDAEILSEPFGPLTKSWVALRKSGR